MRSLSGVPRSTQVILALSCLGILGMIASGARAEGEGKFLDEVFFKLGQGAAPYTDEELARLRSIGKEYKTETGRTLAMEPKYREALAYVAGLIQVADEFVKSAKLAMAKTGSMQTPEWSDLIAKANTNPSELLPGVHDEKIRQLFVATIKAYHEGLLQLAVYGKMRDREGNVIDNSVLDVMASNVKRRREMFSQVLQAMQ